MSPWSCFDISSLSPATICQTLKSVLINLKIFFYLEDFRPFLHNGLNASTNTSIDINVNLQTPLLQTLLKAVIRKRLGN